MKKQKNARLLKYFAREVKAIIDSKGHYGPLYGPWNECEGMTELDAVLDYREQIAGIPKEDLTFKESGMFQEGVYIFSLFNSKGEEHSYEIVSETKYQQLEKN